MVQHLVRTGAFGEIGRFVAPRGQQYTRGAQVIVETARGLECGQVVTAIEPEEDSELIQSGELIRAMTIGDHLLAARLQMKRDAAFSSCEQLLRERGSELVLMDVEHLFSGETLVFYFLGDANPAEQALLSELAETYNARTAFRSFAEAVETGCGPQCGQAEAEGGCGESCTSCSMAAACGAHHA